MSTATAGDLARVIYENKAELALDDGFASRIEPADTDKDAFIVAHQGAAEYINDDTKSFMDRYSDLMYLGAGALSVIGSIFAALYTKVTSDRAGEGQRTGDRHSRHRRADRTRQFAGRARRAAGRTGSHPSRRGNRLRDGTIWTDGLETFKLGYEFVRDEIGMRRDHLKRHAGHEDNVVVVKTAQSA